MKKNKNKCQGLLVTTSALTELIKAQVGKKTLETEDVTFGVHWFVCMPNCL